MTTADGPDLSFLDDPTAHSFIPWPEREYGPCLACCREVDEHPDRLDDRERSREERRNREQFGRPEGAA